MSSSSLGIAAQSCAHAATYAPVHDVTCVHEQVFEQQPVEVSVRHRLPVGVLSERSLDEVAELVGTVVATAHNAAGR